MTKARKDHICEECWGVIKKGEEYSYTSGINNGEFYNHKLCVCCSKMWGYFWYNKIHKILGGYEDEFEFGELANNLAEAEKLEDAIECLESAGIAVIDRYKKHRSLSEDSK